MDFVPNALSSTAQRIALLRASLGINARRAALALVPVMAIAAWVQVPDSWVPQQGLISTASSERHLAVLGAVPGTQQHPAGEFSVADAYVLITVNRSNFLRLPLAEHLHLVAYVARVSLRPVAWYARRTEGFLK